MHALFHVTKYIVVKNNTFGIHVPDMLRMTPSTLWLLTHSMLRHGDGRSAVLPRFPRAVKISLDFEQLSFRLLPAAHVRYFSHAQTWIRSRKHEIGVICVLEYTVSRRNKVKICCSNNVGCRTQSGTWRKYSDVTPWPWTYKVLWGSFKAFKSGLGLALEALSLYLRQSWRWPWEVMPWRCDWL